MIIAIITLLVLVLIMVAKQTIKTSRLESPVVNHPIVEDEVHLFAERPHHPEKGEGVLIVQAPKQRTWMNGDILSLKLVTRL